MVRWLLLLVGILLALDLLDATTLVGAVLGSAGVVGLALGFAFKDIAENYVAGILLSLRRPFSPGDHLLIDKYEGKVVALTSRSTLLMTLDGNRLSLPNALVFKSVVLNYTANPNRRFDFVVPIPRTASIHEAQQLGIAQLEAMESVLGNPGPSWQVAEFGDAWIRLQFFGWIDQRRSDLAKVRSEAIRAVKAALERADAAKSPARTGAQPPLPTEPAHDPGCDTSVNHDIDAQLLAGQRDVDEEDLL
jgi:small-conductance mechanosensitive channel